MSLELAIRHALKNPIKSRGRTSISRFGCIVTDGFSTYRGWNSYRSHPLQAYYSAKTGTPEKIHLHSELCTGLKGVKDRKGRALKGFKMFVARVLADGSPALARPCEACWAAIAEFGIEEVYWTE